MKNYQRNTYSIHIGTKPETLTRIGVNDNLTTLINDANETYSETLERLGYCVCTYEYSDAHNRWIEDKLLIVRNPS